MKFFKGVLIGTAISAGAWMIYTETSKTGKKKIMKQGRKIIKSMGF